jgi:hypothetical protein
MIEVLVFILTFMDEEACVPINVGSLGSKEIRKKISFKNLRLFFSFGDKFKAFKSNYPCMFAIDLRIQPKDE